MTDPSPSPTLGVVADAATAFAFGFGLTIYMLTPYVITSLIAAVIWLAAFHTLLRRYVARG